MALLPRSKHLLISWLQPLSTVILELKKIKFVSDSTFSSSICHEVMGPDATRQPSAERPGGWLWMSAWPPRKLGGGSWVSRDRTPYNLPLVSSVRPALP